LEGSGGYLFVKFFEWLFNPHIMFKFIDFLEVQVNPLGPDW
jgi:hypothetical protein